MSLVVCHNPGHFGTPFPVELQAHPLYDLEERAHFASGKTEGGHHHSGNCMMARREGGTKKRRERERRQVGERNTRRRKER